MSLFTIPPVVPTLSDRLFIEDRYELSQLPRHERQAVLAVRRDMSILRQGTSKRIDLLIRLAPTRPLGQRDVLAAAARLAVRWERGLRLYGDLRWIVPELATQEDKHPTDIKRGELFAGLFLAMGDARQPQITQIGRDRVIALGSTLFLLQEQDLQSISDGEITRKIWEKLTRPVGVLHVPRHRPASSPDTTFYDVPRRWMRPIDLRPPLLSRWLKRRAIRYAEDSLHHRAAVGGSGLPRAWGRVEIIEPGVDRPHELLRSAHVGELELLEVLDRDDPDPLAHVIAEEEHREAQRRLAEISEQATATDREYIELLVRYHIRDRLPLEDAIKAIAAHRGVSVDTVYQWRRRFVKKFSG